MASTYADDTPPEMFPLSFSLSSNELFRLHEPKWIYPSPNQKGCVQQQICNSLANEHWQARLSVRISSVPTIIFLVRKPSLADPFWEQATQA